MATHVLSEVLKHSAAMNGDRLVMIVLADEAGKETREACCSIELISEHARLSVRAVQYSLRRLVAMREVVIVEQSRGGKGNFTVYRINELPVANGANTAPLADSSRGSNGANSAPLGKAQTVQSATRNGANSAPLPRRNGAICDTQTVQSATDTYSGSYSVVKQHCRASSTARNVAALILAEFNRRAERRFLPTDTNLRLITARIRETDAVTVHKVGVRKILEWSGTEMEKFLRPLTVWGEKKFSQYSGELGTPLHRHDGRKVRDAFSRERLAAITADLPVPALELTP